MTGIMQNLSARVIDIAVGNIHLKAPRYKLFDVTPVYAYVGICFAVTDCTT